MELLTVLRITGFPHQRGFLYLGNGNYWPMVTDQEPCISEVFCE